MDARRWGRVAAMTAVAVVASVVTALPAWAGPRARTAEEVRAEELFVQLHNDVRRYPAKYGLTEAPAAPYSAWSDIRTIARGWSDRMAADNRLYHNPDYAEQMCCWVGASENVGWSTYGGGSRQTLEQAVNRLFEAYLRSDGHRANIMRAGQNEFGIGVTIDAVNGRLWSTINFRQRRTGSTAPGEAYYTPQSGFTARERPAPVARDVSDTCGAHGDHPFRDLARTAHAASIACVHGYDIASGKTADRFAPGDTLSRGQTATFLARTLTAAGVRLPKGADYFDDDDGSMHEAAINSLTRLGVITASSDRLVHPHAPMSRGEMAAWVWRSLEAAGTVTASAPVPDYYGDDEASRYQEQINRVSHAGVVTGKAAGRFGPTDIVRRDQMATFLARALDVLRG